MKKLTNHFIILHTAILLIVGIGIWFVLKLYRPDMLVDRYLTIPLFFYLMGLIFIILFRRAPIKRNNYIMNLYMLMRLIKILASFLIILIYWLTHRVNLKNFATIFIIFYLISLIWETYIYLRMEKYLKHTGDLTEQSENKEQ